MATRKLDPLTYLGIAVAVCIGAVLARLAYAYIITSAFTHSIEKTTAEFTERTNAIVERAQLERERQRIDQQRRLEQQRMASRQGLDLQRRCIEWSEFVKESPGEYAIEERDKACRRFREYVATGRIGPK